MNNGNKMNPTYEVRPSEVITAIYIVKFLLKLDII